MERIIDYRIVYLRFLAISLIIFHHSITSISGWPPLDVNCPYLPGPLLFSSNLAKNVGLVLFTFISGYLVAFYEKSFNLGYVWHKFKKIIFPCLFFAILYMIFFPSMMFENDPVNGTHLWYLPMIFVFYLLSSAIKMSSFSKSFFYILIVFVFFKVLDAVFEFRTFTECSIYWPAFVGGGIFFRFYSRNKLQEKTIFVLFVLVIMTDYRANSIISLIIICGTLFFIVNSFVLTLDKAVAVKRWMVVVSDISFELYLLHQFVINALLLFIIQKGINLYFVPILSISLNLLVSPYIIVLVKKYIK